MSGVAASRYASRIGEKLGDLTLVCISEKRGDNHRILGEFACACGNTVTLHLGRTLGSTRTHCGCKTDHGVNRTHGMRGTAEYRSWQAMKGRCLNPHHKDYPRWGGQGITIHQEWIDSFDAFFAHLGPRPAGTTLDRKINRLGYQPGNVRWATNSEQQRNRSDSRRWHIRGNWFETLEEAGTAFGVTKQTVRRWVTGAFDARRGTSTPPRGDCYAAPR